MPIIRPAIPEDIEAILPLMFRSGPEAFTYLLQTKTKKPEAFLRFCLADGAGFFGWRAQTVVVQDNEVVASGAFYNGKAYHQYSFSLFKQVLQFYSVREAIGVLWRSVQLRPLMLPPDNDTHYVANLGTRADKQGQGIGRFLLTSEMNKARELGRGFYALDVAETNPRAQKLYESLGLKKKYQANFRGPRRAVPNSRRLILCLSENHQA